MAPKIGMTLLVRDEADIIGEWLAFHEARADFFCITDNGSVDGTREIIAAWCAVDPAARHMIDEPAHDFAQPKWVDRMIRIARERGCAWVANSDADEFWTVDFRALAEAAPAGVGGYRVPSHLHVPTTQDSPDAATVFERFPWHVVAPRTPVEAQCMAAWNKIFHRTDCYRENILGNHDVRFTGKEIIASAPAGQIDHFSERGWEHFRRKYIQGGEAYTRSPLPKAYGFHWREKYAVYATKGGIVALKKAWRESVTSDFSQLARA